MLDKNKDLYIFNFKTKHVQKFVKEIGLFLLLLASIMVLGILMPVTPRASKSLLFAKVKKDELLKETASPRIIFVGGSNLSFGLNSNIIKDSLKLNPVNTAIHASIGLRFMLDNTLQYVKMDDIIVVVPEYVQFYKKTNECAPELLRAILDVNKRDIKFLKQEQFLSFLLEIPKYVFSKFKLKEYFFYTESDIYSVNSFNEFGDASAHWTMIKQNFLPFRKSHEEFNYSIFQSLIDFEIDVKGRGASMLVSFPGLQDISFENNIEKISQVETEYKKAGFKVLGFPARYKIADSLTFNTPYHLNKNGVDLRTILFIEDFQKQCQSVSY